MKRAKARIFFLKFLRKVKMYWNNYVEANKMFIKAHLWLIPKDSTFR
jgi:hypothetical protein